MDTLTKISTILKQKNKSQKDLTDFLGVSKYCFSDWKSGKSTSYIKYASQIAQYLEVSTDYLLGNEQKEKSLSDKDRLLDLFYKLNDNDKAKLLEIARVLDKGNSPD